MTRDEFCAMCRITPRTHDEGDHLEGDVGERVGEADEMFFAIERDQRQAGEDCEPTGSRRRPARSEGQVRRQSMSDEPQAKGPTFISYRNDPITQAMRAVQLKKKPEREAKEKQDHTQPETETKNQ